MYFSKLTSGTVIHADTLAISGAITLVPTMALQRLLYCCSITITCSITWRMIFWRLASHFLLRRIFFW